jgi:hypothetical protein
MDRSDAKLRKKLIGLRADPDSGAAFYRVSMLRLV